MRAFLAATIAALLAGRAVWGAGLPGPGIPDGLGVNIHFTGAPARDLDMIQAAGFRFVRMDTRWNEVEQQKGVYDFAKYDLLIDALGKRGIGALNILCYGNPLYEAEKSVRTEAGREAFARFAAAAAKRYAGRGIIWELWNEPDIFFWQPQPSVNDYMALAKAVFPAMRQADPQALLVAPAVSGLTPIKLEFIEACFKLGLLDLVDAVTVHPYREQQPPETAVGDVLRLRAIVARYRPDQPDFPIISGEWGYSTAWPGIDARLQGEYLAREFLVNLSLGVPLSIWYDWHDDGPDPKDPDHNYGTVTVDYAPKPAYQQMQRLVQALSGMHFVKRLQSPPGDFLLLFASGNRLTIAAWTVGTAHKAEPIPGQAVQLTGDPQYQPVPADARAVIAEGAWTVRPRSAGIVCGADVDAPLSPRAEVRVRNPFGERITVELSAAAARITGSFPDPRRFDLQPGEEKSLVWKGRAFRRDVGEMTATVEIAISGAAEAWKAGSVQTVTFIPINALSVGIAPLRGGRLGLMLHNPGADSFIGSAVIRQEKGAVQVELSIPQGGGRIDAMWGGEVLPTSVFGPDICITLPEDVKAAAEPTRVLLDHAGHVAADSGRLRLVPWEVAAAAVPPFNDGDPNVPATFSLRDVAYAEAEAPVDRGMRLAYTCEAGWKFVRLSPKVEIPIEGKPAAIGVWVRGDNSNNLLRTRFRDGNDRFFQPTFPDANFTGWRFLTAPMDDPNVGTWGGKPEVAGIAYPIRLNTFILLASRKQKTAGEVDFAGFVLIYRE